MAREGLTQERAASLLGEKWWSENVIDVTLEEVAMFLLAGQVVYLGDVKGDLAYYTPTHKLMYLIREPHRAEGGHFVRHG